MTTEDYLDSNHYETEMLRPEDTTDPHNEVVGPLDDRDGEDPDFTINPELSATNL